MHDDRTTATAAVILDGHDAPALDKAFLVIYDERGIQSRVLPLRNNEDITIGRLPTNSLEIDHDSVSRQHAKIIRRGADLLVEDLGSRNGTRVNGIAIDGLTRLGSGDEITIGPLTAIVGVTAAVRQRMLVGSITDLDERLAGELDRAVRYHRRLGIGMIRLEGPLEAQAAALERVANDLRRMDYLAQYSPEEYAILLPEADRAATDATLRRIVYQARLGGLNFGRVKVHGGSAVCPEDGSEPGKLVSRARAALRLARTGGGDDGVSGPPVEQSLGEGDVIVADRAMKRVLALARKVASAPITVLVLGETGAGKEVVASTVHQSSPRANQPFVALNCSALPETLLESALFGHEKGAFTGADQRKLGYFEAASGGTIFLDEIGEAPLGVQAKLLRVIEQKALTRVGGTDTIAVDVRIVCATNRDLELDCKRGRFREDLFFRLSAFTLLVPPLRDRLADIAPLAQHFARQFARELGQSAPELSADTINALIKYEWPGNVRELRNAMERAIVLEPGGRIEPTHLPERVTRGSLVSSTPPAGYASPAYTSSPPGFAAETMPIVQQQPSRNVKQRMADVERDAVVEALSAEDGNQTRAAKRLGISRFALIRLMRKYELKRAPRR